LTFSGARWYMMTVRDTQMVRDQKKFENHWFKPLNSSLAQSAEELGCW